MGSLEELIELGIIPSSEVLADCISPPTAHSANCKIPDGSLKRLGFGLDLAFSARRSVILFNLQSQVRFEELPWSQSLLPYRRGQDGTSETQRFPGAAQLYKLPKSMQTQPKPQEEEPNTAALKLIATAAIKGFPYTILPNTLLQSMRTLKHEAGIRDLPLTEELATDIFMGKFSDKFTESAHLAADVLEGSVYERYFGLDYKAIREQESPLQFLEKQASWSVRGNQRVVEQQQVITTHNLAACYSTLGMG